MQSFCRQIAARSRKTQRRSAQAIARSTYRTDAKRTSGSFGALGEAGGLDWLLGLHEPNPANAQSSSPVEAKLLKVVASESSVSAGTLKQTYFGAHPRTRGAMTLINIAHTCTYHTVHMTGQWGARDRRQQSLGKQRSRARRRPGLSPGPTRASPRAPTRLCGARRHPPDWRGLILLHPSASPCAGSPGARTASVAFSISRRRFRRPRPHLRASSPAAIRWSWPAQEDAEFKTQQEQESIGNQGSRKQIRA